MLEQYNGNPASLTEQNS